MRRSWCRDPSSGALEFREETDEEHAQGIEDAELRFAFDMYANLNPLTQRFTRKSDGTVHMSNLKNVLRSARLAPTRKFVESIVAKNGGEDSRFDFAFAKRVAREARSAENSTDERDVLEAYRVMSKESNGGNTGMDDATSSILIHKDDLYDKMMRVLKDPKLAKKMIEDAQPDPSTGMIDCGAFVKRQANVSIKPRRDSMTENTLTVNDMKRFLMRIKKHKCGFGNLRKSPELGNLYPNAKKSNASLFEDSKSNAFERSETLALMLKDDAEHAHIRELVEKEVREKIVERTIEALCTEKSPYRALSMMRELQSFHTGYMHADTLGSISKLACVEAADAIVEENEKKAAQDAAKRAMERFSEILLKWQSIR